MLSKQST
jgi:uncharacterized membrane protein